VIRASANQRTAHAAGGVRGHCVDPCLGRPWAETPASSRLKCGPLEGCGGFCRSRARRARRNELPPARREGQAAGATPCLPDPNIICGLNGSWPAVRRLHNRLEFRLALRPNADPVLVLRQSDVALRPSPSRSFSSRDLRPNIAPPRVRASSMEPHPAADRGAQRVTSFSDGLVALVLAI
jgi:hypothetical protein